MELPPKISGALENWRRKYEERIITPIKGSLLESPVLLEKGEHKGFIFCILHNDAGCRCGYILIKESHPWFNKKYSELDFVEVHGGLTYEQLWEDGWWLGFDCAHLYDLPDHELPKSVDVTAYLPKQGVVRTQKYVKQECINLCEQAFSAIPV